LQGEGTNLVLCTSNTFSGVIIFYQGASGAKAAKDGGATLSVALVFVLDDIHVTMESISSSQVTIADMRAVFQR